jgi:hypothetical protein
LSYLHILYRFVRINNNRHILNYLKIEIHIAAIMAEYKEMKQNILLQMARLASDWDHHAKKKYGWLAVRETLKVMMDIIPDGEILAAIALILAQDEKIRIPFDEFDRLVIMPNLDKPEMITLIFRIWVQNQRTGIHDIIFPKKPVLVRT